jgi:hypothetical protein
MDWLSWLLLYLVLQSSLSCLVLWCCSLSFVDADVDVDADVLIAVDLRFMCKKKDNFRSSHHVQILKFQSYQMLVGFHNPEFIRGVACPRPAGAWEKLGEEQDCTAHVRYQ